MLGTTDPSHGEAGLRCTNSGINIRAIGVAICIVYPQVATLDVHGIGTVSQHGLYCLECLLWHLLKRIDGAQQATQADEGEAWDVREDVPVVCGVELVVELLSFGQCGLI